MTRSELSLPRVSGRGDGRRFRQSPRNGSQMQLLQLFQRLPMWSIRTPKVICVHLSAGSYVTKKAWRSSRTRGSSSSPGRRREFRVLRVRPSGGVPLHPPIDTLNENNLRKDQDRGVLGVLEHWSWRRETTSSSTSFQGLRQSSFQYLGVERGRRLVAGGSFSSHTIGRASMCLFPFITSASGCSSVRETHV
ncbi:UNVERIFIED_CONTAM: hypothetical protein GTU68_040980 [Idotea baltica]|nr:hypothetical protein [Idotea baltica]